MTPFEVRMQPIMEQAERVIGIDFAGPSKAQQQRRKIIAISATRISDEHYFVPADGFNSRLVDREEGPGWTAVELSRELVRTKVRVVAPDFPFSIPSELLESAAFASDVQLQQPIQTWENFLAIVASRLNIESEPLNFSPFSAWRSSANTKKNWILRRTDVATRAQAPLKDKFQSLFQMTLLGSVFLGALRPHYAIKPFDLGAAHEVIEIYPSASVRAAGAVYRKASPLSAIAALIQCSEHHGIRIDVDPAVLDFCLTCDTGDDKPDHDAADALVATCTAALHREGQTQLALGDEETQVQQVEGAIYVPVGS